MKIIIFSYKSLMSGKKNVLLGRTAILISLYNLAEQKKQWRAILLIVQWAIFFQKNLNVEEMIFLSYMKKGRKIKTI